MNPRRTRPIDDQQRGAAIVEAALIMPVLLLLVFGVLEMGMLMRDNLTLAQSTRDGARAASAYGNIDDADFRILQIVGNASSAVPDRVVTKVVVFDPGSLNENGAPSNTCKTANVGQAASGPNGACNVYTLADIERPQLFGDCADINTLDRYYCPADREVSLGNSDYIGVWIEFEHRYVTGLFGRDITITDQTIMRIEPKEF